MKTSQKIINIIKKNEQTKLIVVIGPSYEYNYGTLIPTLIKELQEIELRIERHRFVQLNVEDYIVMLITQDQLELRTTGLQCTVITHVGE